MRPAFTLTPTVHMLLASLLIFALAFLGLDHALFDDDDAFIINVALNAGWLDVYWRPEVYQQLSIVHYTPTVLTLYRLIYGLAGLSPTAFLIVQLLLGALTVWLAACFCAVITRRPMAGWLVMGLLLLSPVVLLMFSRFYTMHYVLGALCSLLVAHGLQRRLDTQIVGFAGMLLLLLLAFLSKEVYVMLAPALVIWAALQRRYHALAIALAAGLIYTALRLHVLGWSTDGRQGQPLLVDLLSINPAQWGRFLLWYVQHHAPLMIALAAALWLAPKRTLLWLLVPAALTLPILAAPHAILDPDLHADRLLLAGTLAVIVIVACSLGSGSLTTKGSAVTLASENNHTDQSRLRFLTRATLAGGSLLSLLALVTHSTQHEDNAAQRITRQLLITANNQALMVLTPITYMHGALMPGFRFDGKPLTITQNCRQVLEHWQQGGQVLVFNEQGQAEDPNVLNARCQPLGDVLNVIAAPQFANGVLSWQLQVPDGMLAGVELFERGFSVPAPALYQRLARPRNDEHYRLFATDGSRWWFSEPRPFMIQTADSQDPVSREP